MCARFVPNFTYDMNFFFILFILTNLMCFSNEKSHDLGEVEFEEEKIVYFIKVWGFLKYYHPNVASGNYAWDQQFLTFLPEIERAAHKKEFSEIILNWINGLGAIQDCNKCDKSKEREYFLENFDLSWFNNQDYFEKQLVQKLKFIEKNRHQGNNYYVEKQNKIGNIVLKNEPFYNQIDYVYPTKKYRLLGLAKFWNTVEYFYPYKYLTNEDWDTVLKEMTPKFLNAQGVLDYHLAMAETVVKLNDTHASFYSTELSDYFGRKTLPIIIDEISGNIVVSGYLNDSLANRNDLKIGDVITKIDEQSLNDIKKLKYKYVHGSNSSAKYFHYGYVLFGSNKDSAFVEIERKGEKYTKMLGRYDYSFLLNSKSKDTMKFCEINKNILYVNLKNINFMDMKNVILKLKSKEALILDLRNYPKIIPYKLAQSLNKNDDVFSKKIEPDLAYPGKFYWTKHKRINGAKNFYFNGKTVLLVNNRTHSRAEYVAMLLQTADDVLTIGSQTSGADGDISKVEFLGYKSYMSGAGVFYPDKTPTQRMGIKIDKLIEPTILGLQNGKDEVLEKAIEILTQQAVNF